MIKNISKILGFFKIKRVKENKRIVAFLTCLLIATVLWFLNALSKEYTTTLSYPVKYITPPKNQFLSNSPVTKFELKVDAYGFTLLRHKLSLSYSPIVLNLTAITKNSSVVNGVYTIRTRDLLRRISEQVSSEISISEIRPDIIRLQLDSLKTKTVLVKPNYKLNFKPQFNLKGPIEISPKKVKITGPAHELDTISFVTTEFVSLDKIDSEIKKSIGLVYPDNTSVNPEKVTLLVPVEKFTEKEFRVPVQVINKPAKTMVKLFPSEIKVVLLVGLSKFDNISVFDLKAFVDFSSITPTSETLEVTIKAKPTFVKIIRKTPEKVEFLIEDN
ncbi:MAG: hypothetical protein J7L95_07215 [Prolixibacteraceae bacterium]|nr:hypothetical protein [Prolixibacteraceae bacterium]